MRHYTPISVSSKAAGRLLASKIMLVGLLMASPTSVLAQDGLSTAGKTLQEYAKHVPVNTTVSEERLSRVIALYHEGQYSDALRLVNAILTTSPNSIAAHDARGNIYLAMAQYSRAIVEFDTILMLAPDNSDARFSHGLSLLKIAHYNDAIADFDRLATVDVDNYDVFHYRAFCYYALHQYSKAAADYAECVRIRPADPTAYRNRSLALIHSGDDADAIDCMNVYIGFNPNDAETYFNRGMCFVRLQKWDRAISDLNRFTSTHPDNANAWYQLALSFLSRADREWEKAEDLHAAPDYTQAVLCFNEAARHHKEDASTFFNLGQAYIKLAKVTEEETPYRDAQTALETFLRIAPNDLDAPAVRNQLEQIRSRLSSRQ